jgi:hypothetical protein
LVSFPRHLMLVIFFIFSLLSFVLLCVFAIVIAHFLQYLPRSEHGPGYLILNRSPSDIFT